MRLLPSRLAFLVVSLPLVWFTHRAAAAAPVWRKIETPDFTLYSDAPERAATDCALRYAAFRSVFRQLFVEPGRMMPPSIVIAFRNEDEFQQYTPPQKRGSSLHMVNTHTEIDGMACSAFAIGGDRDRALQLTFEFETIWAMPHLGYYVPLWMAQGSGEILSNLEIRKDRCLIGADDHPRVGEAVPWSKFFAITTESKIYQDTDTLPDYLNQAWALMHWVLFNDRGIGPRFYDMAHRLRTNAPEEAVAQSMATPPDHFTAEIRGHFRHGHYPIALPLDEKAIRASFRISPADPAEILARTAELLLTIDRAPEAEVQLDQAHAFAPDLPAVKEAWARRLFREGRREEALAIDRELIAAGSRNLVILLRSASARLDDMQTGGRDIAGEGGDASALALAEIRHALELDRGNLEAARLLGRTLYVLPKVTDENLSELGALIPPGADGLPIRFYHSLVCQRLGHTADAIAGLRAIEAEPRALPAMRAQANRLHVWMLLERDRPALAPLIEARDFAAARQLVAAGLADLGEGDAIDSYRQLGTWIDEAEAWQKLRDAYEAKRWEETRTAALAYAEAYRGSPRTAVARKLADEAAHHVSPPGAAQP